QASEAEAYVNQLAAGPEKNGPLLNTVEYLKRPRSSQAELRAKILDLPRYKPAMCEFPLRSYMSTYLCDRPTDQAQDTRDGVLRNWPRRCLESVQGAPHQLGVDARGWSCRHVLRHRRFAQPLLYHHRRGRQEADVRVDRRKAAHGLSFHHPGHQC